MAIHTLGERKIVLHGDEHFIADNATIIGSVILHNHSSVWYNAVIRGDSDIIIIGKSCLIGAGALIPEGKTYPDGVLVLGSPGKVVRKLKPEEKACLLENADVYVRRSKLYREQLKLQP